MSRKNNEWPKQWEEILPERDEDEQTLYISNERTWVNLGEAMRSYNGTLYVRDDVGSPNKSSAEERWMPLDEYIRRQVAEEEPEDDYEWPPVRVDDEGPMSFSSGSHAGRALSEELRNHNFDHVSEEDRD